MTTLTLLAALVIFTVGAIVGFVICAIAKRERIDELEEVCAEAYQVVGCLLYDLGDFGSDRAEKILDNLSQMRMVHDDVLPWESREER